MIALAMIVRGELRQRTTQMALTERDDAIQTFFFDRAYEPLRVRIAVGCAIGRLHDTHTRHLE